MHRANASKTVNEALSLLSSSSRRSALPLLAFAAALSLVSVARADELPSGTAKAAPATKGTTDITATGFVAAVPAVDDKDTTELSISAGALSASGNSRLLSLTTASTFRLRREKNQVSAALAANYSRTAAPGADMQTTVENYQGKSRYDRFVVAEFSAFFGVQARRDRFQGLEGRFQLDPGVAYYFVDEEKLQLWGEVGYDLLHDVRREDALVNDKGAAILDADGAPLRKTKTVHSGRLFAGYSNKMNENLTLTFGLEYLQALTDTTLWKLNGDVALTSKIADKFALATAFSLRYDHAPLPGKEKLDTTTSFSLVYTLL